MSSCKRCHAPIVFVTTDRGSCMPLDHAPLRVVVDPSGKERVVLNDGRTVAARIATTEDANVIEARKSHFATCPEAGAFRKRRGGGAP